MRSLFIAFIISFLLTGQPFLVPHATAGFGDRAQCEINLMRQGVERGESIRKCDACFLKPGLPVCQSNYIVGGAQGEREASPGRTPGGTFSRERTQTSTYEGTSQLYRDSETGAARDCIQQLDATKIDSKTITINYGNRCSRPVVLQGVCLNAGMEPFGKASDEHTIHGVSKTGIVCWKK